ncbi:hypothetical protein Q9K02_02105 [Qipengyuania sp. G39]|uniref:Uncharacterized protein n=1 Tax=Qipengyuania profundimaris TaxID=3067652 RepID=A0ABT9HLE0_9SPHN|nr:hypothetical protein [Qipengyuania sp. G39]MDP4573931.1 hypothetical protein [Qipengyuania sp. G39]
MLDALIVFFTSLFGVPTDEVPRESAEPPTAFEQPRLFAPEALGQEGRATLSPGFSPDGRTIYFAQADCRLIPDCPQLLMRARRTPTGWSAAERVDLPKPGRVDYPSVTPDGERLLFSWSPSRPRHRGENVDNDFDLFSLDLTEPDAQPVPIDEPDINRIRGGKVRTLRFVNNETAPSLTTEGDLYFWTERTDGVGLRDVYVAKSDGAGGYRKAQPLPAPINSIGEDDGMWVRPDGRLMLMSYADRGGEGGSDVFVSVRLPSGWSDPEPLGPAVNSRHADFAARVTPDGEYIVFTSSRPQRGEAAGLYQIWYMPVAEVPVLQRAWKAAKPNVSENRITPVDYHRIAGVELAGI